jgi:hypothetical protein
VLVNTTGLAVKTSDKPCTKRTCRGPASQIGRIGIPERLKTPFKSPLRIKVDCSSEPKGPSTLNFQFLDRRVQTLKRAIKIAANEDDDELEMLVLKWKDIGREAAQRLWELIKSNEYSVGDDNQEHRQFGKTHSTSFSETNYEDDTAFCGQGLTGYSSNYDTNSDDQHDIGSMLATMGVDSGILGWDRREGGFVDK